MRLIPQRLSTLISHGLHESEARVYLALLDQARMNAADLAKVTNVPRSHLYKVLQDLHGNGLVDILLAGGTRTYRARPFSEFLERRALELRERLAEIEVQTASLGPVMSPPPLEDAEPDAGEIRLVLGRRAVAREVDLLLESATGSVVVSPSDAGGDRMARQLAAYWSAWTARSAPVEVTVVLPRDARTSVDWRDPPGGGRPRLRALRTASPTISIVVDGRRLIVVHPIPDSTELRAGRDVAVFTDDAAIATTQVELLLAASDSTE